MTVSAIPSSELPRWGGSHASKAILGTEPQPPASKRNDERAPDRVFEGEANLKGSSLQYYGEGCRVEPSMGLLLCSLSAQKSTIPDYERILDRIRPCDHED
jgi:hypothetical protein